MTIQEFQNDIRAGIPDVLPAAKPYDKQINHAPRRKEILTAEERVLAVRNALRYFPARHHAVLAKEFAAELNRYGRIYMYRLRPDYEMYARPIDEYPHRSRQAAAIMMMIQNNLDKAVAQHPHELITYGGNGAVFQNWAQYRLTMKYLSEMTDEQTLVMYSGHPLGLFPSHRDAPRVIVTNGMVIPNYSKPDDWERLNALGVSQYGQMTAGSYMYIGPQGIVHGTTITVMNAARKRFDATRTDTRGMLFVSSGLGGMSGAQPKAGVISGVVSVIAEINPKAAQKRHEQGWVDELHDSLDELMPRIRKAMADREVVSLAYVGNVVDLWERLAAEQIRVDLGSDQTSLHNPWAGGYYPVGLSYEASNKMMAEEPARFRECVQESLRRQVKAINKLAAQGMYFFDYGNAFLLEASRAGAEVMGEGGRFRYPSYVQDIMGPMFFDYGFGPFRWVCASGKPEDLELTDRLAAEVLEEIRRSMMDIHRTRRHRRTARRQHPLDPRGRPQQAGGGLAGPHPLCRFGGPHEDRARVQRSHPRRPPVGSRRAGPRPPRRVGHRLAVPRDLEHLRRLEPHGRHGRAQRHRRCVPRRHVGLDPQRRRRRLGRGHQRRLRHGDRRNGGFGPPHPRNAAVGREQRHRAPQLGAQRRRRGGHPPRNGAHARAAGHAAQLRRRGTGSQGAGRIGVIN